MTSISSANSIRTADSNPLSDEQFLTRSASSVGDDVKRLRVGGRGGAGSRPRALVSTGPQLPPKPERTSVQLEAHDHIREIVKVRVGGRGGAGSQPRRAVTTGPQLQPKPQQTPVQQAGHDPDIREIVKVRVGVRGGAGSHPRRAYTGGPLHTPQSKSKTKFKSNLKLKKSKASLPPESLPSDDFSGIPNPIRPTPISPLLHVKRSNLAFGGNDSSYASSSTASDTLSTTSASDSQQFKIPTDAERRRQKIDKLQRTLGEHIPSERIFHGLTKKTYEVNEFPDPPTSADSDLPPAQKKTLKAARRSSMSTLMSSVLRPTTSQSYHSSTGSLASISTVQTSSLESNSSHFTNASPSVSINESYTDDSPGSPVVFSSPVPRRPHNASSFTTEVGPGESEDASEDTTTTPTMTTLSKSSVHFESSRHIHTHSDPDVWPEPPFMDRAVPFDNSVSDWDQPEYGSPVMRRERRQGWSGEWNQSDMKDVISKLRLLK